ncbi:MAG: hypothetical protein HY260_16735 [Chloroflexi bacterium]|nr:hypothetical protein [Chloroflexota bacterium]
MTTSARTWFYARPEGRAYDIAERVRTTLWDARIGSIWLDVVRAESPYLMRGHYNGAEVEIEWEVGRCLTLRIKPEEPHLAKSVGFVLGFKPALRYEDVDGNGVWEWHTDGGDKRWQAIQGIPAYQHPRRLNKG